MTQNGPAYLVLMLALASPSLACAQTPASAGTAFDGTWLVTLDCPKAADGALGYQFRFTARVTEGMLHGEHGTRGTAGWLALDGPIQPDGTAVLSARGLTGRPEYTVNRVISLTPYGYRVMARFGATRGTGTRVEIRPCALAFEKY